MNKTINAALGHPDVIRYVKLLFLIMAGGAIYPLLYLRQNFELTLLSTFGMTLSELNVASSILGTSFFISYVPSGWLADRFSPRALLTFSVGMTGAIGLWYATLPSAFWVTIIFGLLEGGRGLFEALLATIAVAWFAYAIGSLGSAGEAAMVQVIHFYSIVCLVIAVFLWFVLKEDNPDDAVDTTQANENSGTFRETLSDIWSLLTNVRVWLVALCILVGYQVFWSTYSYSRFFQTQFGLDAVAVAALTTVRLWMRPVGAVIAGFIGDRFHPVRSLGIAIALAGTSLLGLLVLPPDSPYTLLYFAVATSSIVIYGVRGIYWASFNTTRIEPRRAGLAIGMVSMIGYTPEIYMPMLNTYLIDTYGDAVGYQLYFGGVGLTAFLGVACAFYLLHLSRNDAE